MDIISASYIIDRLENITTGNKITGTAFINSSKNKLVYHQGMMENINKGLLSIVIFKNKEFAVYKDIYIKFKIEPAVLITNIRTIQLYCPSEHNNNLLQDAYAKLIFELFPETQQHIPVLSSLYPAFNYSPENNIYLAKLPYLALCKVKRIDYAANLYTENINLYLEMAKKSFTDSRKKNYKTNNNNIYARNKSKLFCLYDKENKYCTLPRYNNITEINLLLENSHNIVRFEIGIINPNKEWLQKNCNFYPPDSSVFSNEYKCGLLPYLSEQVSQKILLEEYKSHIGFGNWYSDYYLYNYIQNLGDVSKTIKKRLLDIIYIISQSRSIDKARSNYIKGGYRLAKTGQIIKGSKTTFNNSLKFLQNLGIQALRIPERRKETFLQNPYTYIINPINIINYHFEEIKVGISGKNLENYQNTKTNLKNLFDTIKTHSMRYSSIIA